jgi:hypothetical protein
MLNVTQVDTF